MPIYCLRNFFSLTDFIAGVLCRQGTNLITIFQDKCPQMPPFFISNTILLKTAKRIALPSDAKGKKNAISHLAADSYEVCFGEILPLGNKN